MSIVKVKVLYQPIISLDKWGKIQSACVTYVDKQIVQGAMIQGVERENCSEFH
jgi:hypothetical protein